MCGIAGFSLSPQDGKVNAKRLAKTLFLEIEHRGHDATGFAFPDANGDIQVHKTNETASAFIKAGRLCLPRKAATAILHTRAATQGAASDNLNNHPIRSGKFVGVHNGIIWNDDQIFEFLADPRLRGAEVDSEAIWAAMMYGKIEPQKALEVVEGSAAVAWLHDDAPHTLHLARAAESPLLVGLTETGSTIFASTATAVAKAAAAVGLKVKKMYDTDEGTYLTVVDGGVVTTTAFDAPDRWAKYRSRTSHYGYGSHYGGYQGSGTTYIGRGPQSTGYSRGSGEVLSLGSGAMLPTTESTKAVNYFFSAELLDLERATPTMEAEDYFRIYQKREKDLAEILANINPTDEEADQKIRTFIYYNLKGLIRQGSRVTTLINGIERYGEVARLPDEFPEGNYIIRAWVPNSERDNGWESIVVARKCDEFKEEPKALDAVTGEELEVIETELDEEEMTNEEFDARVEAVTRDLGGSIIPQANGKEE